MDVIIVCHTEFGYVHNRKVIADKNATDGVEEGVKNLANLADKYGAKATFVVCPEVVKYLPKEINHEVGLHIHPGWQEFLIEGFSFYVGDSYLKEHCKQSVNSTVLRDYPYQEQLEMIETGRDYLKQELKAKPRVFVAGRWSENKDTIKALVAAGFTHDCSPLPHSKADHHDWSRLPTICMPYHPSEGDYQEKGSLPLLLIPISQMLRVGSANPEVAPIVGLGWLKACFAEYYRQNLPLFHICLHSPCMTNQYFILVMDNLLEFVSKHDVKFKFASEVEEYQEVRPRTNVLPYILGINKEITRTFLLSKILKRKLL